jgi:hypothetical protein
MLCCMPRYKPVHSDPMLLPVVLSEQIQPGSFEFALDHLVDHELDLSALDAKFNNDEVGASAYDPQRHAQDRAAGLQPGHDLQPLH